MMLTMRMVRRNFDRCAVAGEPVRSGTREGFTTRGAVRRALTPEPLRRIPADDLAVVT